MKAPLVSLRTSVIFPLNSLNPSVNSRNASSGVLSVTFFTVLIAAPSCSLLVTIPFTPYSLSCFPVRLYRVTATDPPQLIVTALASSSDHLFVIVSNITVLPFSSASPIGDALMPPIVNVTICSSGKALPIPSQSTIGNPSLAAAAIGNIELSPPASIGIVAYTFLPSWLETMSNRALYSLPPMIFSHSTVGAPIIAKGTIRASSGTSSGSSSVTGPHSFMAPIATSFPRYGSPPPPAPRRAAPLAISSISGIPSLRILPFALGIYFLSTGCG